MNWNKQGNGAGRPPKSFEDFLQDIINDPRNLIIGLIVLVIIFAGSTMIYKVEPEEEAIVTRFGKYVRTASPGLQVKMPFSIEHAYKIRTRAILQESFGFHAQDRQNRRSASYFPINLGEESLMLTGDLNIADVQWVVLYRIANPKQYLFNVREPEKNIRDISQAVMRRVVGDRTVNDVLTVGRVQIAEEAKRLTQEIFVEYELGLVVESVELQNVNPPEPVRPSFNDVNVARQEQEQAINRARAAQNKVIPEARGKAEEQISISEGYALAIVNRARGDAEKFKSILAEYSAAPEVTRKRLYLETIEELLTRFESLTIVDPSVKGVLPVFGDGKTPIRTNEQHRDTDLRGRG